MTKFTLVVTAENNKLPSWIYDGHLTGEFTHGLRAETISNGDLVASIERFMELYTPHKDY